MLRFLTLCSKDYHLNAYYTSSRGTLAYHLYPCPTHQIELVVKSFEYMSKLIVRSIDAKAEVYAGEPRDAELVIRVSNPYEAFILALHLDLDKFYLNEDLVCYIPPISSSKIYSYGLRKIYQDIPNIIRLINNTRYIILLNIRRYSGSIATVFNELKRFHNIELDEAIIVAFTGLGEHVYETLGAYVLRCRGYLVAHQAIVSDLIPPPYLMRGVPDLELAYVGEKGAFLYELGLLRYLGKDIKLNIISTGVGEAKGSRYDFSQGLGQLHSYLEEGFYEEAYLVIPEAIDRLNDAKAEGIGVVTWDDSGAPIVVPSERRWGIGERIEAFKSVLNAIVQMHSIEL